ncbi:MAG: TolC family protein [Spirochaetaceae bacterium]|nr:MAG: TolC family protein [Spirochaetaceae bacterium]
MIDHAATAHYIRQVKRLQIIRCTVVALLLLIAPAVMIAGQQTEKRIDLGSFLELVERNSLDLERARTEQRQAQAEEALARSTTRPSLAARAGYIRNLLEIEQSVPVGADTSGVDPDFAPLITEEVTVSRDNEVSVGFELQQLIFDMRAFRALEASRQFTATTATTFEIQRQAVLTAAKKLFYRTILLAEVLEVRRAAEELAYENYLDVQQRHDAGVVAPLDLLRAELNWKTTIPETTQARRNLQIALSNLKSVAGIDPDAAVLLEGTLDRHPRRPDGVELGLALAERPDYRVLQGMRSLREIEVAAGRAEFYPSVSGTFQWGWSASDDGFSFGDGTQRMSAGVQMLLPLYSGGARSARLQRSQLELQNVDTDIRRKIDDVRTDLRNIELTLMEAEDRIELAQQARDTAELAYSITEISAESGVSTQLELKDARVSLVQAQLTYYSATFDYLSAYFDWQQAVGRGADGL